MMNNEPQKPPEQKIDTAAIKIIGVAAGVYLTIMFWYISVPVLILLGLLAYWQYKKSPKFRDSTKAKFGGLWAKFKKFMTR